MFLSVYVVLTDLFGKLNFKRELTVFATHDVPAFYILAVTSCSFAAEVLVFVKIPSYDRRIALLNYARSCLRPSGEVRKWNRKRPGSPQLFRISSSYLFAERGNFLSKGGVINTSYLGTYPVVNVSFLSEHTSRSDTVTE